MQHIDQTTVIIQFLCLFKCHDVIWWAACAAQLPEIWYPVICTAGAVVGVGVAKGVGVAVVGAGVATGVVVGAGVAGIVGAGVPPVYNAILTELIFGF